MASILVVDDEKAIRDSIRIILTEEGYKVKVAENVQTAKQRLREERFDAILLDLWLPDGNGMVFLEEIRRDYPESKVIIITGHGKIEDAVKAIKMGAFDFIEKPFSIKKLLSCVAQALQESPQQREVTRKIVNEIVGESKAIKEVRALIEKFAKTPASVLITGESGTGKDLVAYTIHQLSPKGKGPFVDLNCASVREEQVEEILKEKIEKAKGGSLFLDAVDEASERLQFALRRIIESDSYTLEQDFRLISASIKTLEELNKENKLRKDFLYRISALHIHLPPLRERKEDILPLLDYYMHLFCKEYKREPLTFTEDAKEVLLNYPWYGNVRELRNFVQRVVLLCEKDVVNAEDVREFLLPSREGYSYEFLRESNIKKAKQEFEKYFLLEKLKEYNYDLKKVSQVIGLDLSNLYRKIKQYQIEI